MPLGAQRGAFLITTDPAELALTPARGWMVVAPDNANGPAEAQLITLSSR